MLGQSGYSIGKVCLSCHASIREESDPAITQSIHMISSEPSEYDDSFFAGSVLLPPQLCTQ